jgi:hypothetical protein
MNFFTFSSFYNLQLRRSAIILCIITPLGIFSHAFLCLKMWVQLLTAPGILVIYEVTHLSTIRALAVVLWYHTRLRSKSSPARFPAGRTENIFSLFPLPLLPHQLMSYFDVWRHLSPAKKIRIARKTTLQHIETTAQPAHVKDDSATTTVYWRGADRGDQVVLSGRDNNSTMQSDHTVQKNHINIGIMPSRSPRR